MSDHPFKPGDKVRFLKHASNTGLGIFKPDRVFTVREAFNWGSNAISLEEFDSNGGSPEDYYGFTIDEPNEVVLAYKPLETLEDLEALYAEI